MKTVFTWFGKRDRNLIAQALDTEAAAYREMATDEDATILGREHARRDAKRMEELARKFRR